MHDSEKLVYRTNNSPPSGSESVDSLLGSLEQGHNLCIAGLQTGSQNSLVMLGNVGGWYSAAEFRFIFSGLNNLPEC